MTNPGLSGGRAMLELAERCEKATGPDCELDKAIAEAFGWRFRRPGAKGMEIAFSRDGVARKTPRPTASLDAAMTLVPEGMVWGVDAYADHAEAVVRHLFSDGVEARARTPAAALCAAALRARAADTPSVKP